MTIPTNPVSHDDARFRRDAAHALSTPLGSLLLQSELIEHLLRNNDMGKARSVAATMMNDCESLGRMLREIFAAMADIAEGGEAIANPRRCLEAALTDLGDESLAIEYDGDAGDVAIPARALEALMRRVAVEVTLLAASAPRLCAWRSGASMCLSLDAATGRRPVLARAPFEGNQGLNLWTAREIAVRFGGDLQLGDDAATLLRITLPLAATAAPHEPAAA